MKSSFLLAPVVLLLSISVVLGSAVSAHSQYNVKQLPTGGYNGWLPQINDNGHVVWSGYDGLDHGIFLYDGMSTTHITNNPYPDSYPQINSTGEVAWQRCDGEDCYSGGGDWEIFLYDGTGTTQLTHNDYDDTSPQINTGGYVV